jgi:hypothetical protein
MGNFLSHLFSRNYLPHGHCYLWQPGLLALHVTSDSMIGLSYFLIPASLIYLVRRRRDLVFNWIFWMFAAFILLCGTTHVMNIVTLWEPYYPLEGGDQAGDRIGFDSDCDSSVSGDSEGAGAA